MNEWMIIKFELVILILLGFCIVYQQLQVRRRMLYQVSIILLNAENEVLLVYDPDVGSLTLPSKMVPFDANPTEGISTLLETCTGIQNVQYTPHPLFHFPLQKYDRIRDDMGPAFIVEQIKHKRRCCVLFYVLSANSEYIEPKSRKYPYPVFYNIESIKNMDSATRIPIIQLEAVDAVDSIIYNVQRGRGVQCRF